MLKSRLEGFRCRLLPPILAATKENVQRFWYFLRLCGELYDQRTYKILVPLFLGVVEIKIEISNCDSWVRFTIEGNVLDDGRATDLDQR